MKRLLAAASIGLIALAMATSSTAAPQQTQQLQRKVTWQHHRIHNLEQRRAYLHRYIRHMRHTWRPPLKPVARQHASTASYSAGGSWADELAAVGFPSSAIPQMLYYISRESGGDPSAINSSSGACGLLQLYPCYGGSAWLDPMTNLRLAYQKYRASGFSPWGG